MHNTVQLIVPLCGHIKCHTRDEREEGRGVGGENMAEEHLGLSLPCSAERMSLTPGYPRELRPSGQVAELVTDLTVSREVCSK